MTRGINSTNTSGIISSVIDGLLLFFFGAFLLTFLGLVLNQWEPNLFGTDNRFRAALELLYFFTNSFIVIVAWYAISFAKRQSEEARRQSEEAERARLANVYIEVGNRWFNSPILDSRVAIGKIGLEFNQDHASSYSDAAERKLKLQEFYDERLMSLLKPNTAKYYIEVTAMMSFFEDVGLMARRGYLKIDDIHLLLKNAVVDGYQRLEKHIATRRKTGGDDMYEHFEWLAKKLAEHPKPTLDWEV